MRGTLVISLDFEMYWGMLDRVPLDSYRDTLLGTRRAIPGLLDLFREFEIHATWATVGFLFFPTRQALARGLPQARPTYGTTDFSPYEYMSRLGPDEERDPFHFAASLVDLIGDAPHQEVASHTFCHYYCLRDGQDPEAFRADVRATAAAAARHGVVLESIVFPRNQLNETYFEILQEAGIRAYRGKERRWWSGAREGRLPLLLVRALRLADSYLPISSSACYAPEAVEMHGPLNLWASRYLRPGSGGLLERLRRRRVRGEMTRAAHTGRIYHLWWHPENFGRSPERNLAALRDLLAHFHSLRTRWGMESLTMGELARRLTAGQGAACEAAPESAVALSAR